MGAAKTAAIFPIRLRSVVFANNVRLVRLLGDTEGFACSGSLVAVLFSHWERTHTGNANGTLRNEVHSTSVLRQGYSRFPRHCYTKRIAVERL